MNKPHKHAELIKAWADGARIQFKNYLGEWKTCLPSWDENSEYRIEPEAKEYWLISPGRITYGPYTKKNALKALAQLAVPSNGILQIDWKILKEVKENDKD